MFAQLSLDCGFESHLRLKRLRAIIGGIKIDNARLGRRLSSTYQGSLKPHLIS